MKLRKTMIIKETTERDGFGKTCDTITRVVAIAVIQNPFAGTFGEDLSPLFDISGKLGTRLMDDAVAMLRRDAAPSATAAAVDGGGVDSTALTGTGSVGSEAG